MCDVALSLQNHNLFKEQKNLALFHDGAVIWCSSSLFNPRLYVLTNLKNSMFYYRAECSKCGNKTFKHIAGVCVCYECGNPIQNYTPIDNPPQSMKRILSISNEKRFAFKNV